MVLGYNRKRGKAPVKKINTPTKTDPVPDPIPQTFAEPEADENWGIGGRYRIVDGKRIKVED